MFVNAFMYETLGTPGELPPVSGYIVAGTSTWDRHVLAERRAQRRTRRIIRFIARALFGGWRG